MIKSRVVNCTVGSQLAVDNNYLILLQYHGQGLEASPDFEAGKVK